VLQKANDLDIKGEEPAVLMALALGHGSLGQNQEKEEDLRLALQRASHWLATHPEDDAARYDRGIIYEMLGRYRDAILDFQEVIERDPDYYVAYISLGLNALKLGRIEQAEQALVDAIELAKRGGANPAWAHLNLALVYERSNKIELARVQYEEAVTLSPRSSWMHYSYGRFLEGQKEMEAALLEFEKMAITARDPGWAYGKLGDFLRRHELFTEARASYEKAVHARPEDPLLHAHLAETCFELAQTEADTEQRGRYIEQAHEEFQTAMDQAENLYYPYSSYGNMLFQLGEYQRAAEAYESSLERRAADWGVLLNLGRTYENLDQSERAKEQYLRILDLRDDFPEIALQIACERLEDLGVESPCD
jgi:tetratricopeptide (TPR) repeat protein